MARRFTSSLILFSKIKMMTHKKKGEMQIYTNLHTSNQPIHSYHADSEQKLYFIIIYTISYINHTCFNKKLVIVVGHRIMHFQQYKNNLNPLPIT